MAAGPRQSYVRGSSTPDPVMRRTLSRASFRAGAILTLCAPMVRAQASDPTAALLAELIRANTSNPPGNERLIAELLAPKFRALGIDTKIIRTPDSAKAIVVARLKG